MRTFLYRVYLVILGVLLSFTVPLIIAAAISWLLPNPVSAGLLGITVLTIYAIGIFAWVSQDAIGLHFLGTDMSPALWPLLFGLSIILGLAMLSFGVGMWWGVIFFFNAIALPIYLVHRDLVYCRYLENKDIARHLEDEDIDR